MIAAWLLRLPEVPLMVTVKVPMVAVLDAESVRRLVVAVGFDPKTAVTPLGSAEVVKLTLPLNPFTGTTEIVAEPAAP